MNELCAYCVLPGPQQTPVSFSSLVLFATLLNLGLSFPSVLYTASKYRMQPSAPPFVLHLMP